MRVIMMLFVFAMVGPGCGFLEEDQVFSEQAIIGPIKLYTSGSDPKAMHLVFMDGPQTLSVLVNDCKRVVYDSVKQNIYVEKIINVYNSDYQFIHAIDSSEHRSSKAFIQKEIYKKTFDSALKQYRLIYQK